MAMTMKVDKRFNECARTLKDGPLLAKLSTGDAIAQKRKYHAACLATLYNRDKAYLRETEQEQELPDTDYVYPITLSDIVT